VHATPDAKQPIAIVIPHEANLRHALTNHPLTVGVDHRQPMEGLCANPQVEEMVLKECNTLGKKNGFKTMELLQAVVLSADEWTPENGLVTAAQKIQRSRIAKKFAKEIGEIYAQQ
jgi:long-chain acyl-CoA synthetase